MEDGTMELILIIILSVVVLGMLFIYNKVNRELKVLRKSDYMGRAFLRNFSKEARSPLKAIAKIADTVSKPDLYLSKTEKRDMGDQLRYNIGVVNALMAEVMIFTNADDGSHQLKDEVFSPNALCRRCLEANQSNIYHRDSVKLSFKRELSDEFFVKSDRHVVDLILNKLLLNACRFTEQGEVTVGCNTSENPGYLTIFVSDTGHGIPEHRRNKLFTWFDAPDDMFDEAELDLSICQRLATKLGGLMEIDSQLGKGTRVLLILPLK